MGKRRNGARRNVLLLAGDDIVELQLDTEPGYIVSPDSLEAWEEDINQQFHDRRGRNTQVISELQKRPLKIYQDKPENTGPGTAVLASRKQDEELSFTSKRKEKNKLLTWVAVIVAMLTVTLSALALMKYKDSREEPAAFIVPYINVAVVSSMADKKRDFSIRYRLTNILSKIRSDGHLEIEEESSLHELNEKEDEQVQCVVLPEKTGEVEYPVISSKLIPHEANLRRYRGGPCYLLGLNLDDKLFAIEPTEGGKEGESPKDCYEALECEKEVDAVYSLSEGILEKIKIGLIVGFGVAELIIIFLFVAAASGGTVG